MSSGALLLGLQKIFNLWEMLKLVSLSCISYRTLATEHEALMQKYLHLLQIVETEKTVAKQLRQQIEDGEIETERLKSEVMRSGSQSWH